MTVYVLDGQGGGVGRALVERLKNTLPGLRVIGAGSNALATSAMLKAGADQCATGENAVIYCCNRAGDGDVVAGPMGIVLANSMLGEFTPSMTGAVTGSRAQKVLIPSNRCHTFVAGVVEKPLSQYVDDAVRIIAGLYGTPV